MRIKLRVKHLVHISLAICLGIPLFTRMIVPQARLLLAQHEYATGEEIERARLLKAIDNTVTKGQKWELIRTYMIESSPDQATGTRNYDIFIGPGFTQVNQSAALQTFSWEERIPYLQEYVRGAEANGYLSLAAQQLAFYYNSEGQLDQAVQALENAETRLDGERDRMQQNQLMLERGKLYAEHAEDQKAEQVFLQLETRLEPNNSYLRDGIAKAREQIEQRRMDKDPTKVNDINKMASTVSGVVKRVDGKPLSRVSVFLREEKTVNRSVLESDPYQTITDTEGRYSFHGVVPGSYQLNIGLKFDQISGWTWPVQYNDWIDVRESEKLKMDIVLQPLLELVSPVNQQILKGPNIEFQWQPVPGAAYYSILATVPVKSGSMSNLLRTHITDTRIQMPIEDLYDLKLGVSFGSSGDLSSVDPASILGFASVGSRFSWSVEAYAANGDLLTKSGGYRLNEDSIGNLPFFSLQARTMTSGDDLLMKGQFREALDEYRNEHAHKPEDAHALRMIIRILQTEAVVMGRREQPLEALPYLQEMVKVRPVDSYLFDLAYSSYEQEDWDGFNKWYEQYVQAVTKGMKQSVSSYAQSIHATALMKQGRTIEAENQFEAAMKNDASHRFVGSYLAVMLYNKQPFEMVVQEARKYPERAFGREAAPWEGLVRQIAVEVDSSEVDFKDLLQKLELYFQGKPDQLQPWISTMGQMSTKSFFAALLKVK